MMIVYRAVIRSVQPLQPWPCSIHDTAHHDIIIINCTADARHRDAVIAGFADGRGVRGRMLTVWHPTCLPAAASAAFADAVIDAVLAAHVVVVLASANFLAAIEAAEKAARLSVEAEVTSAMAVLQLRAQTAQQRAAAATAPTVSQQDGASGDGGGDALPAPAPPAAPPAASPARHAGAAASAADVDLDPLLLLMLEYAVCHAARDGVLVPVFVDGTTRSSLDAAVERLPSRYPYHARSQKAEGQTVKRALCAVVCG